jgi:hypothetical protein
MSALKNLTSDESISNEKDSVGGGGVLASGLYPAKITLAYVTTSSGGATGLVLHAKTSEGRDIRSTQWMTSGTAKGGKNFYEKDGVKNYLPGFLLAQSLALLTVGKELSDLDTEQKVANVYSFDAKAEVPTKVDMVMDLVGKEIVIGLIRQTVDKNVKTDNGYVPSGETRDENEIDKFFRASDRKTTAEIRAKAEEAVFVNTWADKWNDQIRDKSTKSAGVAGAPKASVSVTNKKPTASLFA